MLGIILGIYIGTILLLNVPFIQQKTSVLVAKELSKILDSQLTIGHINLGLLNRIIIEDVLLKDQSDKDMVKIGRLSANFDIPSLLKGSISINNVQLFSFDFHLEKQTPQSPLNFQFVVDAFASKDTVPKKKNLDLRINSLLIRRGNLSYDVHSIKETPGRFNSSHIRLSNILANISLKALRNDSLNAAIKRMSFDEEKSGFSMKKLSLKVVANEAQLKAENFNIDLPHSSLAMDTIYVKYDSLGALQNFAEKVKFSFRMFPSKIALQDLSAFVPAFHSFKEPIWIEANSHGTVNQLDCPLLSISAGSHFSLQGNISLQDLSTPQNTYVFGNLSKLHLDTEGMDFFLRNLDDNYQTTPQMLKQLETIDFHGEVSGYFGDFVTYGKVDTGIGSIETDLKLSSNSETGIFSYSGSIQTDSLDLGKLFSNKKLGTTAFNVNMKAEHKKHHAPVVFAQGMISSFKYNEYLYENIELDGEYTDGGFNGKIAMDDPNGTVYLDGSIYTASKVPSFDFNLNVNHFRPHALHLTTKYKDTELSGKLRANFTGNSINNMNGEINLDSLHYISPEQDYLMDNLKITAALPQNGKQKRLEISSNFLTGSIEGDYTYQTLPASIINVMRNYVPSLLASQKKIIKTENNFHFDLQLYDTEILRTVFQIPLKVYTNSTLKGYFDDKARRIRIEGYFPRLSYQHKFFESGMLLCENSNDQFHARMRFTNRKRNGAINISLEAYAQNDQITTALNWGNSSTVTYSGKLSAVTHFIKQQQDSLSVTARKPTLKTVMNIRPTKFILNDTVWQIHPSQIVIDSGKVHINNFNFSHNERHLHINGTLSNQVEDTVKLNLQDINIGYIFDIANLGVNFKGEATGPAYACGVFKKPVMSTDLSIRNFGLNEGLLGDAHIHGEWHHDVKGILLDARIQESDIAKTHVYGYIYPVKPTSGLDLQIEANNTNLKFIHHYMRSITPEFNGRVSGNVHFYGKFKALNMEGRVLGDASLKVEVLNTTFMVKDSILIEPRGLTFRNNRIFDTQGHQGVMNGYLRYQHFRDLSYGFQFNVNNMLVMNTKESLDFPFYGTVYGTGNASISGNAGSGVNIDVAMTTNRNTTFVYMKEGVASAASNQFIRFVDKTPRRVIQDSTLLFLSDYELAQKEIEEQKLENTTDLHLNLLIDATPDADMRIIMDPTAGDYISGRGTGNIRTEFYNKGDVKIFGNYRINQGVYKFSLQEVIRKDFIIQDGSTITFNGNPLDAILDINAIYQVSSASLNDLVPNASNYVDQTNVKVNCIMNMTGQLTSPEFKMSIELPNERDEVQALVRNYIPTDEQMNMQMLYLLSIGKFYTPENVDVSGNSDVMSSVLSSTLSGQLNNALSRIIDSNNWNIGTNFSTGEKGWTDMEFEGILSGQLLNNRLLINGNFGYRDNPMSNTNFVGDFQAEWLVNRSGDIRLKAYNETNNRYYTKTNLTTQGIGIIFKKDFDKWSELLFWNKWKLKRLQKKAKKK